MIPNLRRYFTDPLGRKAVLVSCTRLSNKTPYRSYYEKLSLEEKRKEYKCGNRYKTLDQIIPWSEWRLTQKFCSDKEPLSVVNQELNKKVSIWQGDITHLEIDAIVNAANSSLLGGGGVDGAIHNAAGWSLRDECQELNGCKPGNSKLTSGHRLPAKYILHTVGPMDEDRDVLKSCYETCLQLVDKHNIKSVAFCCVATGVYGYPNEGAAHVALETIRSWLEIEDHHEKIERIIFCVFLDIDYKIYQRLMQLYFPRDQEIPSVEMLQKRLDSLREMPSFAAEDDTNLAVENKSNDQSPMETQETDALKGISQGNTSKDSTQKSVSEKDGHSVDLDRDDSQHPNGDVSIVHDNQNVDVPFIKEDNMPSSGDGKIAENEEKVDSKRDQDNDALSLEECQKDDTPSPETTQNDDLQPSSPSNIPSLPNDQTPLQNEDDDTPPPKPAKNDDTPPPKQAKDDDTPPPKQAKNDDTPPPKQAKDDNTPPPKQAKDDDTSPPKQAKDDDTPPPKQAKNDDTLASPRDSEDTQQSSAMDTSSADQTQKRTSEGEDQLPILHRSVTGPAKLSGSSEDQ